MQKKREREKVFPSCIWKDEKIHERKSPLCPKFSVKFDRPEAAPPVAVIDEDDCRWNGSSFSPREQEGHVTSAVYWPWKQKELSGGRRSVTGFRSGNKETQRSKTSRWRLTLFISWLFYLKEKNTAVLQRTLHMKWEWNIKRHTFQQIALFKK